MDLILSDIHSNLQALAVVLRYVRRRAIRRFVILGDLVGYGAQPNQVLEKIQRLQPRFWIRGNHDQACVFEGLDRHFTAAARQSARWTRQQLSPAHRALLQQLPVGPLAVGEDYVIAHGSPLDEDAYLLHSDEIHEAFGGFSGPLCFFGHTHAPCCFELDEKRQMLFPHYLTPDTWFSLKKGCRYLINPGSVGQPRDKDPRLSFMTFDPRKRRVRLHRLDYDRVEAARMIVNAQLSSYLAERLFRGV